MKTKFPHSPMNLVSSDAFLEIFQSMSEGLIMVNEEGIILVSNPVAEQIFGYDSDELLGMKMEVLLPMSLRKGHTHLRMGFNASPSPRRMGTGRDLMALRKDGKEFPVEVSLSYSRFNEKLVVMAFVSDVSQRKRAEEALKRSEEQLITYAAELEKKVQMRTEALNNLVIELEKEVIERKKAVEETRKALEKERDLNELKSKFVSLASHEFRTPLSSVMSSASLIQQYKDKGEFGKVDKHVARIKSSVGHLTGILNDFLSLGKLEEGKVDIQVESIALDEFFHDIEEELRPTLKEGQKILLEGNRSVKTIISDSRVLRNVLFNLISNASKYSSENNMIRLECHSEDDQIAFSVKDEGIGIPEHDVKHIFERFFRASNANNIQGTGLGLNIVRRYADLLGGKVTFTSQYGYGSIFKLTIPIQFV